MSFFDLIHIVVRVEMLLNNTKYMLIKKGLISGTS